MSFLFDNNLPPALAEALRKLGKSVTHVAEIGDLGPAAPDDLILEHAVRWEHVLVTRDRAMRKTPHFRALLGTRNLGVFFLRAGTGARAMTGWEIAKLVVKAWDDMERFAASSPRPFLSLVQANGRVTRDS